MDCHSRVHPATERERYEGVLGRHRLLQGLQVQHVISDLLKVMVFTRAEVFNHMLRRYLTSVRSGQNPFGGAIYNLRIDAILACAEFSC